jgi:hypothetical protein
MTMSETYRTFNEWKNRGYGVIKGEKSHKLDENNIALFGGYQVVPLPVYKNEDELRWKNNIAVHEIIRERSMCGDKFAAMSCELDRIGQCYGISDSINYGDDYDACDDMEAF